jgi:hypothetical protein
MFHIVRLTAALAAASVCAQPALAANPAPVAPPIPDPAKLELPDLSRLTTAEDEADFDKYFYFHRADASFEQALADIRECDGFARGLASPLGYSYYGTATYAAAGLAGDLVANALISAIFGSAELRKARRSNMRRCMNYKGYDRYGLNKDVWQQFNFEEGFGKVEEDKRQLFLAKQAKAASLVAPAGRNLGR